MVGQVNLWVCLDPHSLLPHILNNAEPAVAVIAVEVIDRLVVATMVLTDFPVAVAVEVLMVVIGPGSEIIVGQLKMVINVVVEAGTVISHHPEVDVY